MRITARIGLALAAGVAALGLVAAPAQAAPGGINNPNCVPSAAFPNPVILIHGFTGSWDDWRDTAPALAKQGACVYGKSFGTRNVAGNEINGFAPLKESEINLANYIRGIKKQTGANKVDIVGHSEGRWPPHHCARQAPRRRQH